jgi:putative transposase
MSKLRDLCSQLEEESSLLSKIKSKICGYEKLNKNLRKIYRKILYNKSMLKVERHYHHGNQSIINLCKTSKELYNKCNYYMRKAWFGKQPLPNISQLCQTVKHEHCFKNLHNTKTAKQTIIKVLSDWSNFRKSLLQYKLNPSKFKNKPKPPNYKKKLAQVIFYNETIRKKPLKEGIITPTNDIFKIKSERNFKQVIITPKSFGFIIEIVYEEEEQNEKISSKSICNIDLGLNNLMTLTSDQLFPILINGRIVKSINQWYNKKPKKKPKKKISKKQKLKKRYFRLENYFHHASKMLIDLCKKHNVGLIIIGKNDGWKQNLNLGKVNNQNFQYVSFNNLLQKIEYKAEIAGIQVIYTEEAYTSKSSFLDRDPLPKYEEGVKHEFSGKRISRGQYRTKDGRIINADVNGSANNGRKVIQDEDLLLKLDRSIAAMPERINPLRYFDKKQSK